MKNIFLIIGTQRSGTTLLSKILSSHPHIYVQNETYLPYLFKENNLDINHLSKKIHDSIAKDKSKFAPFKDVTLWALKSPQFTDHINELESLAKHIKIIIIARDPRGVVNSYMKNKWGLGTNAYTGALRWKKEIQLQLKLSRNHPEQVLFIKYEALLNNVEENLVKISGFLNMSFEKEMLNFYKNNEYVHTTKENKNINKKLDPNISIQWQKELSPKKIGIIERVAHAEMKLLSYKPTVTPVILSKLEIKYYHLHQSIIGEMQLQFSLRKARLRSSWRKFLKK